MYCLSHKAKRVHKSLNKPLMFPKPRSSFCAETDHPNNPPSVQSFLRLCATKDQVNDSRSLAIYTLTKSSTVLNATTSFFNMFSFTTLALGLCLALGASASPISYTNTTILNTRSPQGTCSGSGLVCNGPSQFGLCNAGSVVWQAVAAGTTCSNGQIVASVVAGGASGSGSGTQGTAAAAPVAPVSTSMITVTSTQAPAPAPTSAAAAAATSSAAPAPAAPSSSSSPSSSFTYHCYQGNGEPSAGWPAMSSWTSTFDAMFEANMQRIQSSCKDFSVPLNSADEISEVKATIQSVGKSAGVDARFILAIGLQESGLCVRAPTTTYSVANPGLFQTHEGSGSCNPGGSTSALSPCPQSQITQMVNEGVLGTTSSKEYSLQGCIGAFIERLRRFEVLQGCSHLQLRFRPG